MLRGATAPVNPLKWDLPGGDLEYGEDPLTSIDREILEETGLSDITPVPFDTTMHIDSEDNHWTDIAYKAQLDSPDPQVQISWEHDEYRWVTFDEFQQLDCPPKIKRFVTKYYDSLRS